MNGLNRLGQIGAQWLLDEWNATEQPIQQRGTILPLGVYEDGSAHLAWPGLIMDGIEGWGNLQDSAAAARENPSLMFDDDFNRQAAGDSFLAAGLAATGGLAAGAVPDNALASNGGKLRAANKVDDLRSISALAEEQRPATFDMTEAAPESRVVLELPMDQASRMARAKEMGFDTDNVWYHGGSPDITEFNADVTNRSTGEGVWLTSSYDYAHSMAKKDGKVYELYVRPPKNPAIEDVAKEADRLNADGYLGLSDDATHYDKQMAYFGNVGVDRAVKSMMRHDNDAAILNNFWDLPINQNSLSTAMFLKDPRNIRSVNAAFDPAKADSANLLAANPKEAALSTSIINALEDQAPKGIRAYHGSPHDFDKFSLDKIGTGEGAQVYGHGLYFAKEEAVAKNYRDRLSRKAFNLDGKRLPMDHYLFDAGYRFGDAESTDDALRRMAAERRREVEYKSKLPETSLGRRSVPALLKEADELESMVGRLTENKGRMYKVRINAEPDQFIDWDKPLSQQSEAVRNVIEPLRQQLSLEWADINPTLGEPTHLGQVLASKPQASQALREAGIPGIRYLDGMSRGAGEGSSNYVVFDENLIDILEKYANPWTSAPLGLAPNAFEDPRQALINRLAEVY